jgi:hypothetical protein
MWLMHYSQLPKDYDAQGFAGFVVKDQEFTF